MSRQRAADVRRAATFANPWEAATVQALADRDWKQANITTMTEEMMR
jgi:hypothetical protein